MSKANDYELIGQGEGEIEEWFFNEFDSFNNTFNKYTARSMDFKLTK
jgi:hypothetical protein